MKNRTVLSLEATAEDVLYRTEHVSAYASALLLRNWTRWRGALLDLFDGGMSATKIRTYCASNNGVWLDKKLQDTPLALIAWEYWHDNAELVAMLESLAATKKK